jgi:uncharacterized protein YabN with tetrapyrrole methylase and pyrophosphatase domain
MRYIGIDPGLSGAIAVIKKKKVRIYDTPITRVIVPSRGKHKSVRDYDLPGCVKLLQKIATRKDLIMLEGVTARPITGCVANFSLGRSKGMWEGLITALGLKYKTVHPTTWSNEVLDKVKFSKDKEKRKEQKKKKKTRDIKKAIKLYPNAKKYIDLKKHADRADALLIAEYARRLHLGKTGKASGKKKVSNRSRS